MVQGILKINRNAPPPPLKKKRKKNECKIIVSYCTLPPHWLFLNGKFQNISIPASTEGKGNSKGRGVQKDAISEGVRGGGVVSWGLFPGALSKTGKLLKTNSCSVEQAGSYFTVNGLLKQELLFWLMMFFIKGRLNVFFSRLTYTIGSCHWLS